MLYAVNDIFYSIQGEGYWTGTPAVFVRLAGCNLRCKWCDTDHTKKAELTAEQILMEIKAMVPRGIINLPVVLTGGEPTLQELAPLTTNLKQNGFTIAIESNGTNLKRVPNEVDWITVSPKSDWMYSTRIKCDELKVILTDDINPEDFRLTMYAEHYFLQPLYIDSRPSNLNDVVEYVKENPVWRLSLQVHKMIGIK